MDWKHTAKYLEEEMGTFVDWDEKFFICPECEEPIYESDWLHHWPWNRCPICDFDYLNEKD